MSLQRSLALGALLSPFLGCGGAAAPAAVVIAPSSTAPQAPQAPAPLRRGPSAALMARALPEDDFTLYADVASLRNTPLGQALLPALVLAAKGSLAPPQLQCLKDAFASVQEVMLLGRRPFALVRFDESAAAPAACLGMAGATPAPLDGAADAYRLDGTVIAHLPGLLVLGSPLQVQRSLKQEATGPMPSAVALGDDQYVAWSLHTPESPEVKGATGRLVATKDRFRLDAEADLAEHLAQEIELDVQGAKGASSFPAVGPAETALIRALLADVSVKRSGGHVSAAFDLAEPVTDQLRDLSKGTEIADYAVRKYIANAKTAEARNAIGQIAKDIAATWEREDAPPKPGQRVPAKKLASCAPVPSAVPRGVKYQSTLADWKSWEPIRFSMDAPQYYQYEVRAAKDGQSAEILARGDLNGDGKTSLFRLKVVVNPKGDHELDIASRIEETDPEE